MLPRREGKIANSSSDFVPEHTQRPSCPSFLIEGVCKLKYLVKKESEECQNIEVKCQVLGAMPKVVFEAIAPVFEIVKTLVFNFPS